MPMTLVFFFKAVIPHPGQSELSYDDKCAQIHYLPLVQTVCKSSDRVKRKGHDDGRATGVEVPLDSELLERRHLPWYDAVCLNKEVGEWINSWLRMRSMEGDWCYEILFLPWRGRPGEEVVRNQV